jgi:hypothetical protein
MGTAWAKPYPIEPGPEPTNGDPTGDDRPSPTPKHSARMATASPKASVKVRDGRVVGVSAEALTWYVRHLVFLALR